MITRHVESKDFSSLDHDGMGKAFRAYAEIQLGCVDFSDSDEIAGPKSRLNHQQLATLRETWLRQIDVLEASSLPRDSWHMTPTRRYLSVPSTLPLGLYT